jgi:D-arabinonate dehydratase/D-galactarolactone cycloisomerase
MKITKVEAIPIQAKAIDKKPYWGSAAWGDERGTRGEISTEYPAPQRRRYVYSKTIDTVIVRIETSDGRVGWGEAKAPVAPQATAKIIELLLADIVIGADPRETTLLWERMYAGMRVRGHRAGFYLEAISGIDIALWDLAGQAAGASITTLLGGSFRNPVRVYASGLPALPIDAPGEALAQLVVDAVALRDAGYTGLKMAIGRGLKGDLRSIGAVRDALGEDFLLYADAAGVYSRAQAMWLGGALQDLGVGFFEMPTFPEDVEGYAELARALTIPIALDSIGSRHEAVELIRARAVDVLQPDVCRAGGITECRRIAELADAHGLAFAPHISIGSAIHFGASAHLASAMPNTLTSEYWIGENSIGNAILGTPLLLDRGYLHTPTGPGLGLSIREEELRKHSA